MREADVLWWEEITGPSQLVRAVASELKEGSSVFLCVPDDLPWPDQMSNSVEHILRENSPNFLVDHIDCRTDLPNDGGRDIDVADYLLSRYARPEVKNGYRRSSGQNIQQYILQNQVLKNRVIWVRGMTPRQAESWLGFCRNYHTRSSADGLFVIECHEDANHRRTTAGMKLLFYRDYVRIHDALLFNNILTASMCRSPEWKQYFAAVATQLCGCDVELSASFLDEYSGRDSEDPILILRDISQDPYYVMRFRADFLDDRHPFVLIRNNRVEEMIQSHWRAQLQILFPLLEYERIKFIQNFYDAVKIGLNEAYLSPDPEQLGPHYITQLGERVYEPYDAEIGTLYRMNHLRKYRDNSLYLLYLPEESDRERLNLLRDMRNAIAHISTCSPETVAKFLAQYPYPWKNS